jgi:MFS family permease
VVFGYTLSSVARPLMALATVPWHGLATRVLDRVGKGLRGAPRDALIADVTDPRQRGRAFGFQRAMDHAGAALGPIVAFVLLQQLSWSMRSVFWLAALPGLLAALTVWLFVRDRDGLAARPVAQPLSWAAWRQLDPRLWRVIAIIGLFTLGNSSDAFLLLRARDAGVATALLPLLWVALHLVKMAASTPGGSLSDRLGRRPLIIAGWAVYALVYAGFAYAHSVWQIWGLFAVYGIYFGLTEGAEKALVADLAGAEQRGTAFSLYTFMIGLTALPASLLMGALWERFGATTAFLTGAALALAASLLLWVGGGDTAPRTERAD